MTDLSQALETVAATPQAKTVRDLIERQKPELARALGDAIGVERFTRIVETELRRTPKLYDCDPASLLGAMMLAAQLGLEPGPLGHVYLVPFKSKVEFIVGYKGYIDLAFRSERVKDVSAVIVHAGDSFQYEHGTTPKLRHVPLGPAGEREPEAVYAVARLRTGGAPFVVLYPEDWERARKRSASGSKGYGPWKDDEPAMIRKTAVRRLQPWMPQTATFGAAAEADETVPEAIEATAVREDDDV